MKTHTHIFQCAFLFTLAFGLHGTNAQIDKNTVGAIIGLPLHPVVQGELAGLNGPMRLIQNEYVYWDYPFSWSARAVDGGGVLSLKQGTGMRFIKSIRGGWVITHGGIEYSIQCPPNVGAGRVFRFAVLKATGMPREVLQNRIGDPTRTEISKDGKTVLFYLKEVAYTRTAFETVVGQTTGMIGGEMFTMTTTTQVPRKEEIRYNPYAFAVHLDAKGEVEHIDDLCERAPSGQK